MRPPAHFSIPGGAKRAVGIPVAAPSQMRDDDLKQIVKEWSITRPNYTWARSLKACIKSAVGEAALYELSTSAGREVSDMEIVDLACNKPLVHRSVQDLSQHMKQGTGPYRGAVHRIKDIYEVLLSIKVKRHGKSKSQGDQAPTILSRRYGRQSNRNRQQVPTKTLRKTQDASSHRNRQANTRIFSLSDSEEERVDEGRGTLAIENDFDLDDFDNIPVATTSLLTQPRSNTQTSSTTTPSSDRSLASGSGSSVASRSIAKQDVYRSYTDHDGNEIVEVLDSDQEGEEDEEEDDKPNEDIKAPAQAEDQDRPLAPAMEDERPAFEAQVLLEPKVENDHGERDHEEDTQAEIDQHEDEDEEDEDEEEEEVDAHQRQLSERPSQGDNNDRPILVDERVQSPATGKKRNATEISGDQARARFDAMEMAHKNKRNLVMVLEGIQDTLKYDDRYNIPELRNNIIDYVEKERMIRGPDIKTGSKPGLNGLGPTDAITMSLYHAATHKRRQEAAKQR